MNYTAKLYGKIGRRYIPLQMTSEEVDELEQHYRKICTRLQECVQKHHIGLGGEKLDQLVCDHIEAQAAQIQAMREAMTEAAEQLSGFLGFHDEALSLDQVRALSATLAKLQPFTTPGA